MDKGFPKGGGGSDVWEKFPNNIVFFFERAYLSVSVAGDTLSAFLANLVIHPLPYVISFEKGQGDLLPLVRLEGDVDQRGHERFGHHQLVAVEDQQLPPLALLLVWLLENTEFIPPLLILMDRVGVTRIDDLSLGLPLGHPLAGDLVGCVLLRSPVGPF